MRARSTSVVRLAVPLKVLAQRFSYLLLAGAAVGLLSLGRLSPDAADAARARVSDAFAPVLDALSQPAAATAQTIESLRSLADIRGENERLRADVATLTQWRHAALRLEAENQRLRALLNLPADSIETVATARVVAEQGGSFVRSVLVAAGAEEGLRKGQPALDGEGLVGRVQSVGARSARVLLLTDLNARVPVRLEGTGDRAMLAGDNGDQPQLLYLSPDAAERVAVGDRVVTSGDGAAFPPDIPVGEVAAVEGDVVRVALFADLKRLEYVRIMGFSRDVAEPELSAAVAGAAP